MLVLSSTCNIPSNDQCLSLLTCGTCEGVGMMNVHEANEGWSWVLSSLANHTRHRQGFPACNGNPRARSGGRALCKYKIYRSKCTAIHPIVRHNFPHSSEAFQGTTIEVYVAADINGGDARDLSSCHKVSNVHKAGPRASTFLKKLADAFDQSARHVPSKLPSTSPTSISHHNTTGHAIVLLARLSPISIFMMS